MTARVEEVGDAPLRVTLEAHGGWPVIHGDNWTSEATWRVEQVMGSIVASFTRRVLIGIMVTTDDKNSSARVLQVRDKCMASAGRCIVQVSADRSLVSAGDG